MKIQDFYSFDMYLFISIKTFFLFSALGLISIKSDVNIFSPDFLA